MRLRLVPAALVIAALAIAVVPRAGSGSALHLRLTRSEPAKDSVVTAPTELKLWYSQVPQLRLTRVTLTGPAGAVETGKPVQDSLLIRVPISGAVTPGAYTVSWLTASSDGHPIRGTFGFRVR